MQQVDQDLQRLLHDRVRLAALDVDDEADAAGVVLVLGIVETGRVGRAREKRHDRAFIADLNSEGKYNDHIESMTE